MHDARVALRRLRSALATFRPALSRAPASSATSWAGCPAPWVTPGTGPSSASGWSRWLRARPSSPARCSSASCRRAGPARATPPSPSCWAPGATSTCWARWKRSSDRRRGRSGPSARPGGSCGGGSPRSGTGSPSRVALVADHEPGTAPDESLHEIRKAAKRLRYALETAELVWPRKPKRLRKRVRASPSSWASGRTRSSRGRPCSSWPRRPTPPASRRSPTGASTASRSCTPPSSRRGSTAPGRPRSSRRADWP